MSCPDCQAFRVHFHEERLGQPAARKKPATILVQFTGDLWDPLRSVEETNAILDVAERTPQHTYLFLTQQADACCRSLAQRIPWPRWWIGRTVRNPAELARYSPVSSWRNWISMEPLQDMIHLDFRGDQRRPELIVVGVDYRRNEPFDLGWIREIVRQCAELGIMCYVKQIRLRSAGRLLTKPEEFPEDLQVRQLPWPLRPLPRERERRLRLNGRLARKRGPERAEGRTA